LAVAACIGLIVACTGAPASQASPSSQPTASSQPTPTYPERGKSITMIVPYGAGGGADIAARLFSDALGKELGTTIVVENHEGGSGLKGTGDLAKAVPDGYTIGITPIPIVITMYADPQRGASFKRENFIPFANHDSAPSSLLVRPESPFKTLKDLLDAAKAQPGKVTAANSAFLGAGHLALLSLASAADVKVSVVQFSDAGQEQAAVLGGHVDFGIGTANELAPAVQSGQYRMLAVFDSQRFPSLPSVPTAKELGYNVLMGSNRIFSVPTGTPDYVVSRLASAAKTILGRAEYQAAAKKAGAELNYLGPQEVTQLWDQLDKQIAPLIVKFRSGQ
jgi:tripartite-type tricarboxylate transporter receptor subunit TctC